MRLVLDTHTFMFTRLAAAFIASILALRSLLTFPLFVTVLRGLEQVGSLVHEVFHAKTKVSVAELRFKILETLALLVGEQVVYELLVFALFLPEFVLETWGNCIYLDLFAGALLIEDTFDKAEVSAEDLQSQVEFPGFFGFPLLGRLPLHETQGWYFVVALVNNNDFPVLIGKGQGLFPLLLEVHDGGLDLGFAIDDHQLGLGHERHLGGLHCGRYLGLTLAHNRLCLWLILKDRRAAFTESKVFAFALEFSLALVQESFFLLKAVKVVC